MIGHPCAHIWVVIGLSAAFLTGCGLDPVQPDQDTNLQPDQGIAAVILDTLDPLNAIYIKSADNNSAPTIEINHVDIGVHLFAFVVPAGSYCITRYSFGNYYITQSDPKHGVCFDVIAGKVAYSGNLAPRVHGGGIYVDQNYDWPGFKKMFKEQYPKLAAYPIVTP
ncbi:MAG TPA: hypothetical protein VLG68_07980 [Gammaproteobacteria bacterium]|nr:hypothetical protein [Gammaproteobacteria bacterium]